MLLPLPDVKEFFRIHASLMRFVQITDARGKKGRKEVVYDKLPIQGRFEIHQRFGTDPGRYLGPFLETNPDKLSEKDLAEVAGWKDAVPGKFLFLRQLKKHMIVLETAAHPRVFGVIGLTQPIEQLLGRSLPAVGSCTLLPFRGVILCDGMISSYAIHFGAGLRRTFEETYQQAKTKGTILTTFASSPTPRPTPRSKQSTKKKTARISNPLKRLVSALRKRLDEYRAESALLRQFEEERIPAFQIWLDSSFQKERDELFRLQKEIDELEGAIDSLEYGIPREAAAEGNDAGSRALPPEEVMEDLFEEFMWDTRGPSFERMVEEDVARAYAEFRESFQHAADGNKSAFERTLLRIGSDHSGTNVAAVNKAYRRVAKRLHPDKQAIDNDETKDLWETLRNAKTALDLETIERVETEWRLLCDDPFAKSEMGALKIFQSQLRGDFLDLAGRKTLLQSHPMWGKSDRVPSKAVAAMLRRQMNAELRVLRRVKEDYGQQLERLRREAKDLDAKVTSPKATGKSADSKRKETPPPPEQMEFGF